MADGLLVYVFHMLGNERETCLILISKFVRWLPVFQPDSSNSICGVQHVYAEIQLTDKSYVHCP